MDMPNQKYILRDWRKNERNRIHIPVISVGKRLEPSFYLSEIRDGPLNDIFVRKNNTLVSLNESRLVTIFDNKRDIMVEAFSALDE